MKTYKNLFNQIATFENLMAAHNSATKGKRYRDEVLLFCTLLAENLLTLLDELQAGSYQVGHYNVFYVTSPVRRMVMALQYRDRVVQWAIYRVVYPIFDRGFIHDSYACRKGKGSHAALDRLQYWMRLCDRKPGKWYSLKLDIAKYFYRVDHAILLEVLGRKIKDKRLMALLAQIINCETQHFGLPVGMGPDEVPPENRLEDTGIPIGNLTSQMFANIFLDVLDQYCKHVLHLHFYIRYMDDIIILGSSKEELAAIRDSIATFLERELNLRLNHKTSIQPLSHGVEFVGVFVWPTHRRMRRNTVRGIKRRLGEALRDYKAGVIDEARLDRTINSYKGLLKHCDCATLKAKLNQIYGRYITAKTKQEVEDGNKKRH